MADTLKELLCMQPVIKINAVGATQVFNKPTNYKPIVTQAPSGKRPPAAISNPSTQYPAATPVKRSVRQNFSQVSIQCKRQADMFRLSPRSSKFDSGRKKRPSTAKKSY